MAERREIYEADIDTVFLAVIRIVKERSSDPKIDDVNKIVTYGTPLSLLSYGEQVEIHVNEYKGRTAVLARSSPHLFFNIAGEGRAERNVTDIHEALKRELPTLNESSRTP